MPRVMAVSSLPSLMVAAASCAAVLAVSVAPPAAALANFKVGAGGSCAVPELFAQGVSWRFAAVEQDAVHGCSAAVPDRGSDVQLAAADDARRVREGVRVVGTAP